MNNDPISGLDQWRKDRKKSEDAQEISRKYRSAIHDLHTSNDRLSFLREPWVAALYDYMDHVDLDEEDWEVARRMADIGEQNGLDAKSADAVWSGEARMAGGDFNRVMLAIKSAQQTKAMGFSDSQARMAAKFFIVSQDKYSDQRQLLRDVEYKKIDPEFVRPRIQRMLSQMEKDSWGYQESMDTQAARVEKSIQEARVVLSEIQTQGLVVAGVGNPEKTLREWISKAQQRIETNQKPTCVIHEEALGDERALREKIRNVNDRLSYLRKHEGILNVILSDVKKVSIIDRPDIQEHLLNEVEVKLSTMSIFQSSGYSLSVYRGFPVEQGTSRWVVDNADIVMFDDAAGTSPILKSLFPSTMRMTKKNDIPKRDGMGAVWINNCDPGLEAMARGLEEIKWAKNDKGQIRRKNNGPYSFEEKKFWGGFLKTYDRYIGGGVAFGSSKEVTEHVKAETLRVRAEIQEKLELLEKLQASQKTPTSDGTPTDRSVKPGLGEKMMAWLSSRRKTNDTTQAHTAPKNTL